MHQYVYVPESQSQDISGVLMLEFTLCIRHSIYENGLTQICTELVLQQYDWVDTSILLRGALYFMPCRRPFLFLYFLPTSAVAN